MKKIYPVILCTVLFIFYLTACKKDSSTGAAITVENLAGTYALKALIWNYSGVTINVYDSLDACEKDNLTTLHIDKTADFTDAGIVCDPPENDNGTWDLRGDSLYFSSTTAGAHIESFDGTTLVLKGMPEGTADVIATTTLVKQ